MREFSHTSASFQGFRSYLRMASLHVFVWLLGLVVVCHSYCYLEELEIKNVKNPPKGCVDHDGKKYDFGSKWRRDCMACSCSMEGIVCCSEIPGATTCVPEHCELLINKKACTSRMVLKSDQRKECDLY